MHELVKATKALSDETRLRILNLIMVKECCVCEVMQALNISQTRASRNLNILYDAGFLKMRKEGLWSVYSIDTEAKDYLLALAQAACKALDSSSAARADKERLKKARRVGPGCVPKLATD